jgi:glutamyl-tRNA reductase
VKIYAVGLNHRTAPVEIREKFSIHPEEQVALLLRLGGLPDVAECVLLSTCNRTEAYLYTADRDLNSNEIEREICRFKQLSLAEYKKYFYVYGGVDAVKHLLKVTSGLDSLVWGEDQVLGQVKRAFAAALKAGTTGAFMNTLFREAVTAAKLLKSTRQQSRRPVSAGALAVQAARSFQDGQLENKTAVLIGAGEMGRLVLKELVALGICKAWITSRNRTKVAEITRRYPQATAFDYSKRYGLMDAADLIISATAGPHYTITADSLKAALSKVKKRVFIDLAVPRDIDDAIRELPGVTYLNIDQISESYGGAWEDGRLEVLRRTQFLEQRVLEFERWYAFRNVVPLMREIQASTDGYIEAAVAKLKHAGPAERAMVRRAMRNLANHLLNKCFYSVGQNISSAEMRSYFECLGKSWARDE